MREFVFGVEYEAVDPLAAAFDTHPTLRARSLDAVVGNGGFQRVERVTGSADAVERVAALRADGDYCPDRLTARECDGGHYYDRLSYAPNERVLYAYSGPDAACESAHAFVAGHLPPGPVVETYRRGPTHWWRVLARDDDGLGALYDDLTARLREGLTFRMGHLRDAESWSHRADAGAALPPEQVAAVRAAVDAGYYDPPREVTLERIATDLDVPRSTLSYRLRRAESHLLHRYVDQEDGVPWVE